MAKLKCFTWNMQRGHSIDHQLASGEKTEQAQARLSVLTALCQKFQVGFITEAGSDLAQAIASPNTTSVLAPEGYGYWNYACKRGSQHETKGCYNLLFDKLEVLEKYNLLVPSGAGDATRYPAAGIANIDNKKVLLATIHATSGSGSRQNTQDIFDYIDKQKGKKKPDLIALGGDFNFTSRVLNQPKKRTQKSGGALDGFYTEAVADNAKINIVSQPEVFRLNASAGWGKRGTKYQEGWWDNAENADYVYRLSDHAPLTVTIELS